jgi:hypothetical protein
VRHLVQDGAQVGSRHPAGGGERQVGQGRRRRAAGVVRYYHAGLPMLFAPCCCYRRDLPCPPP